MSGGVRLRSARPLPCVSMTCRARRSRRPRYASTARSFGSTTAKCTGTRGSSTSIEGSPAAPGRVCPGVVAMPAGLTHAHRCRKACRGAAAGRHLVRHDGGHRAVRSAGCAPARYRACERLESALRGVPAAKHPAEQSPYGRSVRCIASAAAASLTQLRSQVEERVTVYNMASALAGASVLVGSRYLHPASPRLTRHAFTQDARTFVRALAGAAADADDGAGAQSVCAPEHGFDHIVMNLPASAIQFLGAAAPPPSPAAGSAD
jgi:hypothetical protein